MIDLNHKHKPSIIKRFEKRDKLMQPIIKKFKHAALVHAVDSEDIFKKIINKGIIKLPKKHNSAKRTANMEDLLKINNTIFLSVGFVYATAYNFKFNLLFDLTILKKADYYKRPIVYKTYRAIVDYIRDNDKEALIKLSQKNNTCKKVVDKYLKTKVFEFWLIDDEAFEMIKNHKKYKEFLKIGKIEKDKWIAKSYISSRNHAKQYYASDKSPEVIIKEDINLFKDKSFLGFYIEGKISKDIMKILETKYSDKILYDGKTIKII